MKFASIKDIPAGVLPDWHSDLMNALRENMELLCGARIKNAHALTNDVIQAAVSPTVVVLAKAATATAVVGGGGPYADGADYAKLCSDVSQVIRDLNALQNQMNTLIKALRS